MSLCSPVFLPIRQHVTCVWAHLLMSCLEKIQHPHYCTLQISSYRLSQQSNRFYTTRRQLPSLIFYKNTLWPSLVSISNPTDQRLWYYNYIFNKHLPPLGRKCTLYYIWFLILSMWVYLLLVVYTDTQYTYLRRLCVFREAKLHLLIVATAQTREHTISGRSCGI